MSFSHQVKTASSPFTWGTRVEHFVVKFWCYRKKQIRTLDSAFGPSTSSLHYPISKQCIYYQYFSGGYRWPLLLSVICLPISLLYNTKQTDQFNSETSNALIYWTPYNHQYGLHLDSIKIGPRQDSNPRSLEYKAPALPTLQSGSMIFILSRWSLALYLHLTIQFNGDWSRTF